MSQQQLPDPILVTDESTLDRCIAELQKCEVIALDTEFMRTDTFYPILGLVQLFGGHSCWLIDPLAVEDLSSLTELLTNSAITKVLHSCSEDLEVLQHTLDCVPTPLFDTQIAAAMTGYGFSRGYAALVDVMLGIHVPKGETRSDWLKRPLRDAQLGYAASDVYHLIAVYQRLKDDLESLGRSEWMDEEIEGLLEKSNDRGDAENYYLRVKGAWQLNPVGLASLKLLCVWREAEARDRNRPRNRVVPDRVLLEIALLKPGNNNALAGIDGMTPGLVRRYGETLLELLRKGSTTPRSDCPTLLPQPLPRQAGEFIKQLKKIVIKQSEVLDLPTEMLARKKDLEAIVRSVLEGNQPQLPLSVAEGWRNEVIGKPLLAAARQLT